MPRNRRRKGEDDLVRRDGALAVTFVNAGSRRSPRLRSYEDLLAWSRRYGGLTAAEGERLAALAAGSAGDAAAAFAAAEELHGLLSVILNRRADRSAPQPAALAELDALLARIVPRRRLVPGPESLAWDWPADRGDDLHRPLWAVALSATDLLTSADYGKVRRCAGEDCDVLFLAKSPGTPRKWCSDRSCGAPRRSRRHYLAVRKPEIRANRQQRRNRYRDPGADWD